MLEDELNPFMNGGGLLARIFRPLFRFVSHSWQMAPLGFLFGLGFDTASEIALFSVAVVNVASGASIGDIMIFPALFAAGMALIDTSDSVLMVGAYGWAFLNPIRKIWYNLTITAISVLVALGIGGLEVLGLVADRLGLSGGVWNLVGSANDMLASFGYFVIGLFVVAWIISMAIFRWRGYDRIAVRVRRASEVAETGAASSRRAQIHPGPAAHAK